MIHISRTGKKVPCKARKLPCPRGNAGHYPDIVLDLEEEGDIEKLEKVNEVINRYDGDPKSKRKYIKFIDDFYHFNEDGDYVKNEEKMEKEIPGYLAQKLLRTGFTFQDGELKGISLEDDGQWHYMDNPTEVHESGLKGADMRDVKLYADRADLRATNIESAKLGADLEGQ